MTIQQILILALQTSILLTVFGFGLRADVDDVLYLVRRPSLLSRSLLAMFLFVPLVAWCWLASSTSAVGRDRVDGALYLPGATAPAEEETREGGGTSRMRLP